MNKKSLITLIIAQALLIGVLVVIASDESDESLYQSKEKNLTLNDCGNCDKTGECTSQNELGCNPSTSCKENKISQCENNCTEKTTCRQIEKQQRKCNPYFGCSNNNVN